MTSVDSQNVYFEEMRSELKEIKNTLRDLAMVATTQALHSQRMDNMESRITKIELTSDEMWEAVTAIRTTCQVRERVYLYGLRSMEDGPKISRENWRDILIGSAVRNGIWIAVSAGITAFVMQAMK